MRIQLWSFDTLTVDLEDRDVSIKAVHAVTGAEVVVAFRLSEKQLRGSPLRLRKSIEMLATDKILDLA